MIDTNRFRFLQGLIKQNELRKTPPSFLSKIPQKMLQMFFPF